MSFLKQSVRMSVDKVNMNILKYIIKKWFNNTVYIRFKSDCMSARRVEKNRIHEDKPILALIKDNKKYKVMSVGKDAEAEC